MPDLDFHPQTAREALFEIRLRIAEMPSREDIITPGELDAIAALGLERREPFNFELGDEVGDRLAEAHRVLRRVDKEGFPDNTDLEGEVAEALVLPPQLEAIVERRIGPAS